MLVLAYQQRIRVIRIGIRGKFKLKKSCIVLQLFQGFVRFQRLGQRLPTIWSEVVAPQSVKGRFEGKKGMLVLAY